jgi:hypothetical protein
MKKITKLALIAVTAAGLTFAGAAAPASATHVTITLDADGSTLLPLAAAAADWSKNTNVRVVTGDCTGTRCVHFKEVTGTACLTRGAPSGTQGCAYRLTDGSCQVEVSTGRFSWPGREYLDDLITKHEAGHCIFSYGGKSTAFHLPDSPHALMSAVQSGSPTRQEATLTSVDRSFTRTLYN